MNAALDHTNQKHARLMQSVFMYVATCLKDRDHRAVSKLRLRSDQMARISSMTATDLLRLGELGRQCVSFDIDPEALDAVLRFIDQRRHREELIERCIRCDAPRAMMKAFFGLSRHRYSKLRAMLGMPPTAGRSRRPPEAIERQVYEHWAAHGEPWSAQRLLDLAQAIDVSLRVVWDQLRPVQRTWPINNE